MRHFRRFRLILILLCLVFLCAFVSACAEEDEYGYGICIQGPATVWNGEIPESEECQEQLRKLYWHVGVYRNESNGYTLTIMNNSMTGLDYTMIADFPGIGSFEMGYVTVSQDAKYVIFYSENGEIEAHVHLPTDRNPRVKYYLFNPDLQEMIGTGVIEYDTWEALPGSYDRDPRQVWVNDWYDWDNDAALSIRENGNGTYHFIFQMDPVYLEYDVELQRDYELNGFDTPDGAYYVHMWLDGVNGCCLELEIQRDDWNPGDPYYEYLAEAGDGYAYAKMFRFYAEEYPPDLTLYGWRPWFDNSGYDEVVFDDWADPFGVSRPETPEIPEVPAAEPTAVPAAGPIPAGTGRDHTPRSLLGNNDMLKVEPDSNDYFYWVIWLRNWRLRDNPNTTIDFTDEGFGRMHMTVHFDGSPDFEMDLIPGQIAANFTDPVYGAEGNLYLQPTDGGVLQLMLTNVPDNADYGGANAAENGGTLYFEFIPDDPIDPDWWGHFTETDPVFGLFEPDEPEETTDDGDEGSLLHRTLVFSVLKYLRFTSSSGAGAWSAELKVDGSGRFTGEYYDADAETVYMVNFSGRFGRVETTGDGRYILTVDEADTEMIPGAQEEGEYGELIIYEETILPAGSRWLLTLPGTQDSLVPETVQGLITGTYGGWENPADFATLTRIEDGWGFFARTKDSGDPNIFSRELFLFDSYGYNNDLALIAAKLCWEIEDGKSSRIQSQMGKYNLEDICCYVRNKDYEEGVRKKPYREWTEGGDGAFAFGKKVISFYERDDTTILVVVARGTMMSEWKEEALSDYFGNYGPVKTIAGHPVNWNIARYEYAMWEAMKDYLNDHPINTPNVKILITGHSLGGAMTNAFGAQMSKEYGTFSQLEGKTDQGNIYVYTFGAINVLRELPNADKGFENIHNIYNTKDSFGVRGNKGFLWVSNQSQKFGHTDLYQWTVKEENIMSTNNHNMDNYYHAVESEFVHCVKHK